MNRHVFLLAVRCSPEPTAHLLMECEAMLLDNPDGHVARLIGEALDRWRISKEEMRVRNRLTVDDLNKFLDSEPMLQAGQPQ